MQTSNSARSTEAGSASQASLPETSAASARPSPAVTLLPSGACAHLPVPTAAQPAEQQPNVAAAHQLILQRISLARKWSRAQFRNKSNNNNSKEVNVSSCSECHMPAARPRLCLACGTCLCASDLCHRAHCKRVVAAAQNNSIGLHHLAYDPAATVVSCAQCRDVAAFVSFPSASSASSSGSGSTSSASSSHSSSPPSMISSSSSGSAAAAPTPAWPTKPRGILNLGNTCYATSILQCLLHTPGFRNYFLGDRHNPGLCQKRVCATCELDNLFTLCYSRRASTAAFGPASMLWSIWKQGSSLDIAGYGQQDCHEWLVAALNYIHSTTEGAEDLKCPCIAHTTFGGRLQSEVQCKKCKNVTTRQDPFLDLSLELDQSGPSTTLRACLARYTAPETLRQYACTECHDDNANSASKQLRFSKLPSVLCVVLKRFSQTMRGEQTKVDTHVTFPLHLDMAPYVLKNGKPAESSSATQYSLYAAVIHHGSVKTGHYTTFIRSGQDWYYCNDEAVNRTGIKDVLKANPYLLLYSRTAQ